MTSADPAVGHLRSLEVLQAEGCPLVQPYNVLYKKDPLLLVRAHDQQLQELDLSEANLDEFPMLLLQLTNLTSLNLSKNSIKASGL
jgi:Leucine-rich repeat (LRR) protein